MDTSRHTIPRGRLPLGVKLRPRRTEHEGTSFTDYVLAQRLACAHRLLTDPRHATEKISAIALDAGFGDLSYFNRMFRRRYGETPSGVRGLRWGGGAVDGVTGLPPGKPLARYGAEW